MAGPGKVYARRLEVLDLDALALPHRATRQLLEATVRSCPKFRELVASGKKLSIAERDNLRAYAA